MMPGITGSTVRRRPRCNAILLFGACWCLLWVWAHPAGAAASAEESGRPVCRPPDPFGPALTASVAARGKL
jgi:hypothetical protein